MACPRLLALLLLFPLPGSARARSPEAGVPVAQLRVVERLGQIAQQVDRARAGLTEWAEGHDVEEFETGGDELLRAVLALEELSSELAAEAAALRRAARLQRATVQSGSQP